MELLGQQHREVESLFEDLETGTGDRTEVLRALASRLAAHMRIEEEIFYPRIREVLPNIVLESLEEHTLAAFALKRLAAVGVDHESFAAKLKALKDVILHHVREEETDIFPRVARAFDESELEELGAILEGRFRTVIESGYGASLVRSRRNGKGRRARISVDSVEEQDVRYE
jgi:hemerythrin superfamily protein